MKFTKVNETYQATRKDGQVIIIEKNMYTTDKDYAWRVTYEGDWDGDNTAFARTKKELVENENWYEDNM